MTVPSKGDVVWVDFPETDDVPDEEMDDPHMAVVFQNQSLNHDKRSTIVVPITSGEPTDRTCEVSIPSHNEPVDHQSKAVVTKMTCVSIPERIHSYSEDEASWKEGELSIKRMNEIETRIGYVLGV